MGLDSANSASQSQRDGSIQPWVARNELPKVIVQRFRNPERVESDLLRFSDATPSGLGDLAYATHGRPSPSWANHGLNDAIPLGLKPAPCTASLNASVPIPPKTAKNLSLDPNQPLRLAGPPRFCHKGWSIIVYQSRRFSERLPRSKSSLHNDSILQTKVSRMTRL
jgi:hypothetical protein